jgi:hypothetical protein
MVPAILPARDLGDGVFVLQSDERPKPTHAVSARPARLAQGVGKTSRVLSGDADEHIDLLTKKYLGKQKYPFRSPGEVRVLYEIEPTSVATGR